MEEPVKKLVYHFLGVNAAALVFAAALTVLFDLFTGLMGFIVGLLAASALVYSKHNDK